MIYIIISNVGMTIMMIFIYYRYSRFHVSGAAEVRNLCDRSEEQLKAIIAADNKFLQETKVNQDKIQSLLAEINELRKDKENEVNLRLDAEKQIELALQKADDIERRVEDWQFMQDAMMNDCKDAMHEIGNDLYKKLNEAYKKEVAENKNLIEELSQNIAELFDQFSAPSKQDTYVATPSKASPPQKISTEDQTKELIADLVAALEDRGYQANKNYFTPENFDEQRAKLMLCELAFYRSGKLYLIDFKSCRYLAEYNNLRLGNEAAAQFQLQQRFDKYLAYLSNSKYRASILKALAASKINFEQVVIIAILPSHQEIEALRKIGYDEKARNLELAINDFDEINNIFS